MVFLFARRLTLLSMFVIVAVVLVTYFSTLRMGFWMDDFINIDMAGRFSGVEYWARVFDPRLQRLWYRPIVGTQWKITHTLFAGDPTGYHLLQVLYHCANALLLYWVVVLSGLKRRVGLVSALLYGTWALSSMAVYWPSVHDPVASVFYLLAIGWWMGYLQAGNRSKMCLAFLAFIGSVMSKEVGATVPIILFLIDRLVVAKPISISRLVARYAPFAVILTIYAVMQFIVVSQSEFTQRIGYSIGLQMTPVFLQYLSFLAFPWEIDQSLRYAWLGVMSLIFVYAFHRTRRIIVLGAMLVLPTLIVAPIPAHLMNPRYLYVPLMASALGFGLLFEWAASLLRRFNWIVAHAAPALVLALAMLSGSGSIDERVQNFAGFTRELRLQFRPIYQLHLTHVPDTLLYFLDTPLQSLDISGLMFLRYGANAIVSGIDRGQIAGLREHNAAFVYYLDDQNHFQEQAVARNVNVTFAPDLPARFNGAINLEGVEIVNAQVKRGEALVALLYWRPAKLIGKDYSVFAHLINPNGQTVSGADSQPQRGRAPTTTWLAQRILVDCIVIPIDAAVLPGEYQLQFGLYDSATMQRLAVLDSRGDSVTDSITVAPIQVGE